MVRIPRCGCLTSYKSREKDTYLTRSRLQAWSFLFGKLQKGLNSCRNGEVLHRSCETVAEVAESGLHGDIIAT